MGILDQLREEANKKQTTDSEKKNIAQKIENTYLQEILPRMQQAFQFMKEVVDHLNFLEQAVEIVDYSRKYPQLGKLVQTDYKINTDGFSGFANPNRLMQINVTFYCVGEGEFFVTREGKVAIDQEVAFLSAKKIDFEWNRSQGPNGIPIAQFRIRRRFPVRFRFEVDYDRSKIILLIHNHIDFDAYKKIFEPKDVNSELLDEIARFMLRKDCDFIRLDISADQIRQIKQHVERVEREREAFLKKIAEEEEQLKNKKTTFLSRINPLKKKDE